MQTIRATMSLLLLSAAVFVRWQDPQPVKQPPVVKPPVEATVSTDSEPKPEPKPKQEPKQEPKQKQKQKQEQKQESASTAATKSEGQIIGKPKRDVIEGVYRLRYRVTDGLPDQTKSCGYMAITSRYLFLSLASQGRSPALPLLHSGVREWRKVGNEIHMTAKLDYATDDAGGIHQTPDGRQEVRRIEIIRGGLRVMQGMHSWLEFERVE